MIPEFRYVLIFLDDISESWTLGRKSSFWNFLNTFFSLRELLRGTCDVCGCIFPGTLVCQGKVTEIGSTTEIMFEVYCVVGKGSLQLKTMDGCPPLEKSK